MFPSTTEYGVILTEVTLSPHESPPVRQMTAVLLKQYVDTHWCCDADKFVPPEATPAAKAQIKKLLPEGLKESISKVGKRRGCSRHRFDLPSLGTKLLK